MAITGTPGADVLNGTGGDDVMSGGDGNDTLRGGAGSDLLDGGTGDDILDGGTGADTMTGGTGNDTYIVDNLSDVVIESSGQGVDLVKSYVDYALGGYLENLTLMGTSSLQGSGNDLANSIKGNDAANSLWGLGGNDQIDAGAGNDMLFGGAGSDWLKGGAGADAFVFAAADIAGGSATDQIADLSFASGDSVVLAGFREGAARTIGSYAALVNAMDSDPNITVVQKNESGQINVAVRNAAGNVQTITITDATTNAWSAFSAAAVRPVAGADTASTDERTAVSVNVLANDTWPGLSVTAVQSTSGHGETTLVNNQVVFAPGGDYNYLRSGESADVTLNYTLATEAGRTTTGTVTVTVNGVDNAAEIRGEASGSVEEDGTLTVAGRLTVTDADHDQSSFEAATIEGTYGALTINSEGGWEYVLNNQSEGLELLNRGESAAEHIVVHSRDGTAQSVEITVHGSDERIALPSTFNGEGDPGDLDGQVSGSLFSTVSSAALAGPNTLYGTSGADTISSGNGNDTVLGWAGDDTISGGQGVDTLYGGSGNDHIDGNQAGDTIYGGSGDDIIRGLQGDDRIIGGYGADTLTGNEGADTFVFLGARDTNDTITDFTPGSDKIDLSFFTSDGQQHHFAGPQQATQFSAGHDLIWTSHGATTVILGDTDGDYSTAEFMLTIIGQPPLTAADFML